MASNDELDMSMEVEPSRCAFLYQPSVATIDIDKRGDLILLVGKHKCKIKANGDHQHTEAMAFRVCSRSLARSSPVMEAMLFGNFREATQTTIELTEDDPKAMQMLLHRAHGSLKEIYADIDKERREDCPEGKFVDDVYSLVVLANKYLMTQHFRPFMAQWCNLLMSWEAEEESRDTSIFYERLEKSMWIASEFGHLELYQTMFRYLTWHLEPNHHLFRHVLEPDGVADHIRLGRLNDINSILTPTRNAINALMNDADPTGLYLCNQPVREDRLNCQAHTLGHMIRNLTVNFLWPLPNAEDITETAQELVVDFQNTLWQDHTSLHENCTTKTAIGTQTDNTLERSGEYDSIPLAILQSMYSTAEGLNAFEFESMFSNAMANVVHDDEAL
ncbi:hypothetical protein PFICI_11861 [Pestalotiopsis fici W106-1]|uniref:BTB domain-containing protein n=1 Tax=Pestalotiopsis fici (strain W106-1 / CGMCC3.15140) TaxID=1229662 RepID=W3WRK6_PESFW|nr:uncharacterized protein PFICI_11861 [Pestalotiopsis fici W106-1]ETS76474.1 hypothetical protein PFICI_11861 [Pestalotiopsis fici W106-1]